MGSLGLYIHVPFCAAKCRYCDFHSAVVGAAPGPDALIPRLVAELTARVGQVSQRVRTVFVGGGTPTSLSADPLAVLLAAVRDPTGQPPDEFTVEANPESLDAIRAEILVEHGVDRVSIGAQSFQNRELECLGRIHNVERIAQALREARRAGVSRISLDLMFGIPGQTADTWRESLDRAVEFNVDHLSCYALTYEPGTPMTQELERGVIRRCDESLEADMYLFAIDRLAEAGFEQYEISNFARAGQQCRHNLGYWHGEPYLGVGPSAVGCMDGVRYRNVSDVGEYIRRIDQGDQATVESEPITPAVLARELTMLGLRLTEGIDVAAFRARTGIDPLEALADRLADWAQRKLLRADSCRIALTREGLLVADDIAADLMARLDDGGAECEP